MKKLRQKEQVLQFLQAVIDRAAFDDADRVNVCLDVMLEILFNQDNEVIVQGILNKLGKTYQISAPVLVAVPGDDEIPF